MGCFNPGDLVRYVGVTFRAELGDVCCVVTGKVEPGTTPGRLGAKLGSYGIRRADSPEDTVYYVDPINIEAWSKIPHWDEEQV